MKNVRTILLLGLLFPVFGALSLSAQDQGAAAAVTEAPAVAAPDAAAAPETATVPEGAQQNNVRVTLFVARFADDATFNSTQRRMIAESLVAKLGQASASVHIVQYTGLSTPSDSDLNQSARDVFGDAWIVADVSGNADDTLVRLRCYDMKRNVRLFDEKISTQIDTKFRNLFGGLWAPYVQLLHDRLLPYINTIKLTFKGEPGTTIEFKGLPNHVLDSSGTWVLDVVAPASYTYRAYTVGKQTVSAAIFLDDPRTIDLKLPPFLPIAFEASLLWASFPDLNVGYYLIPDSLRVDFATTEYIAGIVFGSGSLIKGYPLLEMRAGIAWDLLPRWTGFGINLGANAILRLAISDGNVTVDQEMPIGFGIRLGMDLNLSENSKLFAEINPRLTYAPHADALTSGTGSARTMSGADPILAFGTWILEPLIFRVGVRLQP